MMEPKMKNLWLLTLVLLAGVATAQTKDIVPITDGNTLLAVCRYVDKPTSEATDNELTDTMLCTMYVTGVVHGFRLGTSHNPPEHRICTPEDSSFGQYTKIVLKHLKEHPEDLHKTA